MNNTKPKILLCEDDTNLGMVLKNYLELNDFDVVLERDGSNKIMPKLWMLL